MKRFFLILGVVACLMIALPSFAADNKPIRLKMATFYFNKHPVYQFAYKNWIDQIKKRTNGRVIITYYNPKTIVPPTEILDATLKGRIDIGSMICGRNPGRFPLTTVTSKIPVITSTTLAASMALYELWKTTPAIQEEFKGLHIFAMHQAAPSQIATKYKAIHKVEEIKGLRLACPSKDSFLVGETLGANMIKQTVPELYLALSRNMAEGLIFPVPPMRSFKTNEATKYTTLFDFFSAPFWFGMNQAKWDSLPPDIKKVFDEVTVEVLSQNIGKALDKGTARDMEVMKKEGMEFIVPTKEQKDIAAAILKPALKEGWLKELAAAKCTYADTDGLYNKALGLMNKNEKLYGSK